MGKVNGRWFALILSALSVGSVANAQPEPKTGDDSPAANNQTPDENQTPANNQAPDNSQESDENQTPANNQAPDNSQESDENQTPANNQAPDNSQAPDENQTPANNQAPDNSQAPPAQANAPQSPPEKKEPAATEEADASEAAQDVTTDAEQDAELLRLAALAEAEADAEVIEVATGSRLKHSSLVAPLPLTILDAEDLLLSGRTDVVDAVSRIPALVTSTNIASSQDQSFGTLNPGVSTLNLRGLGANRTLVLVDGHRHVGGRAGDTAVDITTIPASLIERVEVLSGGASAIYGADAVSGVVNFIMKKDFDGAESRAQYDVNDGGEGSRFFANATVGSNFADDRGNAVVSVDFIQQQGVRCGALGFCKDFGVLSLGETGSLDGKPFVFRRHQTFALSSAMGRIGIDFDGDGFSDPVAPDEFFLDTDGDGVNDVGQTPLGAAGFGDWVVGEDGLRLFNPGEAGGFVNQFGGDGIAIGPFDDQSVIPASRRAIVSSRLRYKLGKYVNAFADSKFAYNRDRARNQVGSFNDALTIRLDNPYIPQPLRQALDSAIEANPALADTTTIFVNRDFLDLGPQINENERTTIRLVTGLEGELPGKVQYTAAVNYGRTSEELITRNARIDDRFFAALDAVTGPDGQPACRSSVDPTAPPPPTSFFPFTEPGYRTFNPGDGQCKPLNIFGFGAPSQEAIDFITTDIVRNSVIDQWVSSLTFVGDSKNALDVELPAGPVGFAAGLDYRKESSRSRFDEFSKSGLVFDGSQSTGVAGDFDTWGTFYELSIPIVKDEPFAKLLNFNGALRVATYSTVGTTASWRSGLDWAPTNDIRFRGGYGVSVRAPNVGELYQPTTAAFFMPIDPCDASVIDAAPDPEVRARNCADDGLPMDFVNPNTGRFAGEQSGNPDLKQETANTYTIGGVLTPRWVPGLIVSVDYFSISLDDAIDVVSAQDIVNNCYDDPSGLDNQFCNQFTRDRDSASGTFLGLNFLEVSQLNVARKTVAGVDFEAMYVFDLDELGATDMGKVGLRTYGTWLRHLNDYPNQNDESFVNPSMREARRPKLILNWDTSWHWKSLALNYGFTYMSKQTLDGMEVEDARDLLDDPFANPIHFHNLAGVYEFYPGFSVYGGVNNMFNAAPLGTSTSFPMSPLGRLFFLGLNSRL